MHTQVFNDILIREALAVGMYTLRDCMCMARASANNSSSGDASPFWHTRIMNHAAVLDVIVPSRASSSS